MATTDDDHMSISVVLQVSMWLESQLSVCQSIKTKTEFIHSIKRRRQCGHAKTAACCFAEQLIFMLCQSPGSDAESADCMRCV